ncbi:hypothetical protein D1003_03770 [Riemerella anatipestifer]|nr:hypothetical protein [Riemerella anatipestifer]
MLGAFSVQKGSFCCLSALAFPLVLCVFREGRRFLMNSRFKVQIFKEQTEPIELQPSNFKL